MITAAASQDIGPVWTGLLATATLGVPVAAMWLFGRRKYAATREVPATDDPEVTE